MSGCRCGEYIWFDGERRPAGAMNQAGDLLACVREPYLEALLCIIQ